MTVSASVVLYVLIHRRIQDIIYYSTPIIKSYFYTINNKNVSFSGSPFRSKRRFCWHMFITFCIITYSDEKICHNLSKKLHKYFCVKYITAIPSPAKPLVSPHIPSRNCFRREPCNSHTIQTGSEAHMS